MPRGPGRNGRPWRSLRAQVLAESAHCALCGEPIDMTLSGRHPRGPAVDHITPLVEGGNPLDRANLQAAHTACNTAKENKRRAKRNHTNPSRNW